MVLYCILTCVCIECRGSGLRLLGRRLPVIFSCLDGRNVEFSSYATIYRGMGGLEGVIERVSPARGGGSYAIMVCVKELSAVANYLLGHELTAVVKYLPGHEQSAWACTIAVSSLLLRVYRTIRTIYRTIETL